ncbi:MAG: hypothetical protein HYY06_18470 [Deltaproteobacteria bacterium]|nr:hypothetical protein [Deltaproteobacteria bacterium]
MAGPQPEVARRRRRLKSATERLLQDGHVVDDPTEDERAELRRIEHDLGLIEVSWRKYFLCVDHADDEDLAHAWKRECDQKIEIDPVAADDPLQHEDDLRYVCRECGRVHWPTRRRRTLYDRAVVSMPDARIAAFFERCVRELESGAQQLDGLPVYRLGISGHEAYACLLDHCTETRFATRSFASTNALVYVTAAPRVFMDRFPGGDEWIRPLPLHELAREGSSVLRVRLEERAADPLPAAPRDPPARPFLPLRSPAPRVHRERVGIHDLVIAEKSVSLDGIEVLSSRAKMQVAVVRALADRRLEDLRERRAADGCRWVLAKTLLGTLGDSTATDEAETVSKYINRARADIAAKYEEQTGIAVGADEIIESSPKGYRLNPARVAVRFG